MFKRFYDTKADVYDDLWDTKYSSEKKCEYHGSIMADIQPFRVGTIDSIKKEKYGVSPDSTKKLYCENNDILKQGMLVDIGTALYRCAYVEKRDMGMMAVLRQAL